MGSKLYKVGKINKDITNTLGLDLPVTEVFQSRGLEAHIRKRNHFKGLQYLDKVPEIIANPDYIGTNPNHSNSIELIKVYNENILVAIQLDANKNYLYVASVYKIQQSKIDRRLESGRLKLYNRLTTNHKSCIISV